MKTVPCEWKFEGSTCPDVPVENQFNWECDPRDGSCPYGQYPELDPITTTTTPTPPPTPPPATPPMTPPTTQLSTPLNTPPTPTIPPTLSPILVAVGSNPAVTSQPLVYPVQQANQGPVITVQSAPIIFSPNIQQSVGDNVQHAGPSAHGDGTHGGGNGDKFQNTLIRQLMREALRSHAKEREQYEARIQNTEEVLRFYRELNKRSESEIVNSTRKV